MTASAPPPKALHHASMSSVTGMADPAKGRAWLRALQPSLDRCAALAPCVDMRVTVDTFHAVTVNDRPGSRRVCSKAAPIGACVINAVRANGPPPYYCLGSADVSCLVTFELTFD